MLSVVVVTFNRLTLLQRVVASIFRQQRVDFELLIVDNGSNDSTAIYAKDLAQSNPKVRFIGLKENLGVPAALNIAFEQAHGDIFFVMDDDEELSDTEFFYKAQLLNARYPWDLLTTCIVNDDGKEEPFLSKPCQGKDNVYVSNFLNGSIFIRRQVYEQLSGMEGFYFRQGQENEYALRAILYGYHILYTRELKVYHYKIADNRPKHRCHILLCLS